MSLLAVLPSPREDERSVEGEDFQKGGWESEGLGGKWGREPGGTKEGG